MNEERREQDKTDFLLPLGSVPAGQQVRISQDLNVVQKFLGHLPPERAAILVVNIGANIGQQAPLPAPSEAQMEKDLRAMMIDMLARIPTPRYSAVIKMMLEVAVERHGTQVAAAAYLGITRRILNFGLKRDTEKTMAAKLLQPHKRKRPVSKEQHPGPRKCSAETRRKMSESRKRFWAAKKAKEKGDGGQGTVP